jgi:HsdM N-terminal domain
MLTGEIRSQIDSIWNDFWSGGVSNPLSVIEQITYLLFIKRLDELQTVEERKAATLKIQRGAASSRTGKTIAGPLTKTFAGRGSRISSRARCSILSTSTSFRFCGHWVGKGRLSANT